VRKPEAAYQRQEALQRLAAGETQTDIAQSYGVSHVTIALRAALARDSSMGFAWRAAIRNAPRARAFGSVAVAVMALAPRMPIPGRNHQSVAKPSSTRRRRACANVGLSSCCAAQCSTAARSSPDSSVGSVGSRGVSN
jgi:hypothetical protein